MNLYNPGSPLSLEQRMRALVYNGVVWTAAMAALVYFTPATLNQTIPVWLIGGILISIFAYITGMNVILGTRMVR